MTDSQDPDQDAQKRSGNGLLRFLACQALVFAVAGAGALATAQGLETWYPTISKSVLTPPNWVFPVVWNILFFLMGLSLWLAIRAAGGARKLGNAWISFGTQLALNLSWSIAFFALHLVGWAVLIAGLLAVMIVATMRSLRVHSSAAAWLLLPYALWVSFATYLTATIWVLNA